MADKYRVFPATSHDYSKKLVTPDGITFRLGMDVDDKTMIALRDFLNASLCGVSAEDRKKLEQG